MPGPSSSQIPLLLRELRWEDFPSRRDSYYDLYEEVRENPGLGMTLFRLRPTEAEEAAWFSRLYQAVQQGDSVVVVAEVGGRAVGMVSISGTSPGSAGLESSHVGVLGVLVDRGHRGQGVGSAMILRALELARRRFERVRLLVFETNVRAKALYERLGFRATGRFVGEVKRGGRYLDEELMTLDLRTWQPPPEFREAAPGSPP